MPFKTPKSFSVSSIDPEMDGIDASGLTSGGKYKKMMKKRNLLPNNDSDDDLSDDEDVEALAKSGREHYQAVGVGKIGRQAATGMLDLELADPKYAGKKVSRRDLIDFEEQDDEDIDNDDEDDLEVGDDDEEEEEGEDLDQESDDDDDDTEDDVEEYEDEDEEDEYAGQKRKAEMEAQLQKLAKEETKFVSSITNQAQGDVDKGMHVKAQMSLWDSFLEFRMDLQKPLVASNLVPTPETFPAFKSHPNRTLRRAHNSTLSKTTDALTSLLDDLVSLQTTLISKNPAVSSACTTDDPSTQPHLPTSRKRKAPSSSATETIDTLRKDLTSLHTYLLPFRTSTIEKWNAKVVAASGGIAGGLGSSKKFRAIDQSVLTQIQSILSDKERLVKRTKLVRFSGDSSKDANKQNDTAGRRVGDALSFAEIGKRNAEAAAEKEREGGTDEFENADRRRRRVVLDSHLSVYDNEVFDDGDFYQQLLRELIEGRMADSDDPVMMSMKWAELKRLQNKQKRKNVVDTKSSKGRKIRYHVHEKLVNFMVPQPRISWHESMIQELFAGLFGGRGSASSASSAAAAAAVPADGNDAEESEVAIPDDGLRLFG